MKSPIDSIYMYDSPMVLLEENCFELAAEEREILRYVNDWTGIIYYVVNDRDVLIVDSPTGSVLRVETLQEFYRESIEYCKEEIANEC